MSMYNKTDYRSGEYAIAKYLKEVINEDKRSFKDFFIHNNIIIPADDNGHTRQLDHLLVSPNGVYVFKTKNWNGVTVLGITEKQFFLLSHLQKIMDNKIAKTEYNFPANKYESFLTKNHGLTLNFNFSKVNESDFVSVKHYGDPIDQVIRTAQYLSTFLNRFNNTSQYEKINVRGMLLIKTKNREDVISERDLNNELLYSAITSKEDVKSLLHLILKHPKNEKPPLKGRTDFINSIINNNTSKVYQRDEKK